MCPTAAAARPPPICSAARCRWPMPGTAGMVDHIKAGKLRPLATTGVDALAAVARRAHAGRSGPHGLLGLRVDGPAGTQGHAAGHRRSPVPRVERTIARRPRCKGFMTPRRGVEIVGSTPAEFDSLFPRGARPLGAFGQGNRRKDDTTTPEAATPLPLEGHRWRPGKARSAAVAWQDTPRGPHDYGTGTLDNEEDRRRRRAPVPVGEVRRRRPAASPPCCSCTARRWPRTPTFDLTVPGRPDSSVMDWFAERGFAGWCVDMEGYGRSTRTATSTATFPTAPTICRRHRLHHQDTQRRPASGLRHLVRRAARGAVRAAPSRSRDAAGARRLRVDRRRRPTLAERRKKLPEFLADKRRPIDRAFVHSIFERDHPGFRRRQRRSKPSPTPSWRSTIRCPNGTYIDMCSKLPVVDPEKITVPTMVMRGQYDGIAGWTT